MKPDAIAAALAPVLADACGAESARIDGIRSMTGGAAREAWRLDVTLERPSGEEARSFVALVFRPAGSGQRAFEAVSEAELLRAAARAGVPVPAVICAGEAPLGRPFYVMDRIEGETIGRRLVREERFAAARARLPRQLGEALAAIHRVPVHDLAFLPRPKPGVTVAQAETDRLEELYRVIAVEPHPVFELAFRWLRANLPETRATTLVHGDFRIGNVIVDEHEGLRAVLDWELAHAGDPVQDLAWACVRSWRFGADALTFGGVGRREELFAAYEEAGGQRVDPSAVRFWEVFGNLNWGVITLIQVRGFLDGAIRSAELAAIGRRAAETEWELLNLIEGRV
ncbi:MAG: phosphotransferase family protein [Deltaproteobacteria bacterium]|nr:phosphotransferase family protein [Deltaproteobacteria bacterium]